MGGYFESKLKLFEEYGDFEEFLEWNSRQIPPKWYRIIKYLNDQGKERF